MITKMSWNKPSLKPHVATKRKRHVSIRVFVGSSLLCSVVTIVLLCLYSAPDRQRANSIHIGSATRNKVTTTAKRSTYKHEKSGLPQTICTDETKQEVKKTSPKIDFEHPTVDMRNVGNGSSIVTNKVQAEFLKYFYPGSLQLPTGKISDQTARAAIEEGVTIDEGDDTDVRVKKELLVEFLDELRQYMDNGGSAMQYFKELDKRQNDDCFLFETARSKVIKEIHTGDIEVAKMMMEAYNKLLNQRGVNKEIRLSDLEESKGEND